MSISGLRPAPARPSAVGLRVAVVLGCTLLAVTCANNDQTCPVCPTPTPLVASGSISVSPMVTGIAWSTTFTFGAQGFRSTDDGTLSYAWDFDDGTSTQAGVTVAHAFQRTGQFDVKVTVRNNAGITTSAEWRNLAVVAMSGRWGVRDATGHVVFQSVALTQNGITVTGDENYGECRYDVAGAVSPQRGLTLTFQASVGALRPPVPCPRPSRSPASSTTRRTRSPARSPQGGRPRSRGAAAPTADRDATLGLRAAGDGLQACLAFRRDRR